MNITAGPEHIRLAREVDFALGKLEVRPSTREVFAAGQREVLEPRVMQVLVALSRRKGEVVSREELIIACWAGRVVGDDAINRCIARVRKLGEASDAFMLDTVPRVGYRLLEITTAAEDATVLADSGSATDCDPAPQSFDPPIPRPAGRRLLICIAAAATLVVVGLIFWIIEWPRQVAVTQELRNNPKTDKLVAVLPFTPLYADSDAQRFGDSIATAVADALSRVGQHVVPPANSFQFRGNTKANAARALDAAFVIDGEVRREGAVFAVAVRVEDAATGATILARSFEAPARQAEALPDRVAASVAAISWGYQFTNPELHAGGAMSVYELEQHGEYYAAYQTARALANRLPDNVVAQMDYAAEAMNLFYSSPATRKMGLVLEARKAEQQAVRLAPGNGNAYGIFASTTPEYMWGEREGYIRKALTLSPESIGAAGYLTWLLVESGRFNDAEPFANSIHERFPYEFYSFARPAARLMGLGKAGEAQAIILRARRLWPDDNRLLDQHFEATALSGDLRGASLLLQDHDAMSHLPSAKLKTWRDILRALKSRRPDDIRAVSGDCGSPGDEWWSCMVALAALGQLDPAFRIADSVYPDQRGSTRAALEQKWIAAPIPFTHYLFLPATASMRADPRFPEIVDRVGLLPYWKSTHHIPDFCANEQVPLCRQMN